MTITQSSKAQLVVVGGSTGNQGGSVIDALDASEVEYRIRGLTRDANKPGAAADFKKRGVEMVSVQLDPEHKQDIVKAYEGADVVFSMTNFWQHVDGERELAEGKAMIDSAIEAKVPLFIFSALPPCGKLSNGKYTKIVHFEYKAKIADYGHAQAKSHPNFKFQTVEAGFYDSNILPSAGGLVRKGEDGKWFLTASADVFQSDSKPLPAIDIPGDYGLWVQAVIENEALQTDPRPVLTSGEDITLTDLLDQLEKRAGIQIERKLVTQEEAAETQKAAGTPPHIIEDFADMWDYNRDFGYYGGQDVHWADKYLSRKPKTFAQYLESADLSDFSK